MCCGSSHHDTYGGRYSNVRVNQHPMKVEPRETGLLLGWTTLIPTIPIAVTDKDTGCRLLMTSVNVSHLPKTITSKSHKERKDNSHN